jgi:hypothetical protein
LPGKGHRLPTWRNSPQAKVSRSLLILQTPLLMLNARPTNHRIAQLEQENASLRRRFLQMRDENVSNNPSLMQAEPSLAAISPARSQVTVSPPQNIGPSPIDHPSSRGSHPEAPDSDHHRNSISLYHGPTSAVYDDTAYSGIGEENAERLNSPIREEWTRHILFAETARQSKCALT